MCVCVVFFIYWLQVHVVACEKFEDTKGAIKRKSTKGQTIIYKTLHRKLKIEQQESYKKNMGAASKK
jgi:hypothetical protein